jgi:hypothetical protein
MAKSDFSLISGQEREILAQMIADDEMQEAGVDGFIGPYRLVECLARAVLASSGARSRLIRCGVRWR